MLLARPPCATSTAAVTTTATIELRHSDHAMLRRAPLWHRIATGFVRLALGLGDGGEPVADAFQTAAAGGPRLLV